jgi:hypothetical protein
MWIQEQGVCDFLWQGGYADFSVSASNVEKVRAYIVNQEEHHRRTDFKTELRVLLKKHGVDWDERYVWD